VLGSSCFLVHRCLCFAVHFPSCVMFDVIVTSCMKIIIYSFATKVTDMVRIGCCLLGTLFFVLHNYS